MIRYAYSRLRVKRNRWACRWGCKEIPESIWSLRQRAESFDEFQDLCSVLFTGQLITPTGVRKTLTKEQHISDGRRLPAAASSHRGIPCRETPSRGNLERFARELVVTPTKAGAD
jgi:hypothetical protein